jgi:hypothetical protein
MIEILSLKLIAKIVYRGVYFIYEIHKEEINNLSNNEGCVRNLLLEDESQHCITYGRIKIIFFVCL